MRRLKKIGTLSFLFVFIFVFSGCNGGGGQAIPKGALKLEIWGVYDDTSDFSSIISEYRKINPFISNITYRKFSPTDYKDDLIDALAAGNGPDIFMINNAWMPDFENKVAFAPNNVFSEKDLRDNLVDVAAQDFLGPNNEVMGTTLSVDSLALYYNKDIFNSNGITSPPRTWDEFVDISRRLTRLNESGDVVQSGAAMGSVSNVNRSVDIIDMLLFQNGVALADRNEPTVNLRRQTVVETDNGIVSGGVNAVEFFTDFADPASPAYSWSSDQSMHYSLDEFYEGDLAMMFNFSWHYETIKSKNSKLNFSVASIPQLNPSNAANVANYWAFCVSENKSTDDQGGEITVSNDTRIREAWQFLKFMTVRNNGSFELISPVSGEKIAYPVAIDPAKDYLEKTNKPAARRDIVEEQKNDPFLGPFAEGNLIAKSWRRRKVESVEAVWAEVVSEINRGSISVSQGVEIANNRINNLLGD